MANICHKEDWKGRCCCNCKHQRVIMKHPWNLGAAKGKATESMGFGCAVPEFDLVDGRKTIMFMDREHSLCEMHERL